MTEMIKVQTRTLICSRAVKLFCLSFFSFFLRWGLVFLNFLLIYSIAKEGLSVYFTPAALFSGILSIIFISGIRLGEQYLYFTVSRGNKCKISHIFKFTKIKKAFFSSLLYFKLNFIKLMWFIYFMLPSAVLSIAFYYLRNEVKMESIAESCITVGITFLGVTSLLFYRTAVFRLSAAPFYYMLKRENGINSSIKKSIKYTDEYLVRGVLFELSLMGWVLSSFFILPLVFAVPYIKLGRTLFIIKSAEGQLRNEHEVDKYINSPPIVFTAYKEGQ